MKIAFIGAGNMAEAIVSGIIKQGVFAAGDVTVTDIREERLQFFKDTYGTQATADNKAAVAESDVIVLAVKPQMLDEAAATFAGESCEGKLFVSIMAGVTAVRIEDVLNANVRVVRVMPNTPALVGCGAAGYAAGSTATADDLQLTSDILSAVGVAVEVKENELDAVTALSGSGPAYVFYLLESMLAAADEMGLKPETARKLALATVEGSAKLMDQSGEAADELRAKVTSKGGTTFAATTTFDKYGVNDGLVAGLIAARDRSLELSGN
ncbi:pyrroline-5-carboxylate reductase [Verrucomicrobiota bacterium]